MVRYAYIHIRSCCRWLRHNRITSDLVGQRGSVHDRAVVVGIHVAIVVVEDVLHKGIGQPDPKSYQRVPHYVPKSHFGLGAPFINITLLACLSIANVIPTNGETRPQNPSLLNMQLLQ